MPDFPLKRGNKIFMQPGVDYIGVGVGAILLNDQGEVFLSLRGPLAKNERGKWEIPGGAVNFGETLEEAIIRETYEEFGIRIKVKKLLDVNDHILPEEKQHWVSPSYICEIIEGEPKIMEPGKTDRIGWFSLADAQKLPLAIVTKRDVEMLKKSISYST